MVNGFMKKKILNQTINKKIDNFVKEMVNYIFAGPSSRDASAFNKTCMFEFGGTILKLSNSSMNHFLHRRSATSATCLCKQV